MSVLMRPELKELRRSSSVGSKDDEFYEACCRIYIAHKDAKLHIATAESRTCQLPGVSADQWWGVSPCHPARTLKAASSCRRQISVFLSKHCVYHHQSRCVRLWEGYAVMSLRMIGPRSEARVEVDHRLAPLSESDC